MSRARVIKVIVVIGAVALGFYLLLGRDRGEPYLSGYIEGENLFLAAPVAGTVGSITAVEGARVAAGQQLFEIEPATLSAQGEQAEASLAAAETQIRTAEANAQQAQSEVTAAAATADRARADLARLLATRSADAAAVASRDIDQARAALREADARVAAAREAAQARRTQVAAARSQAAEAQGGRREVQIRVNQLAPPAPAAGRIEDVYFQRGEWVSANQPVVSLLPDAKIKVRFFVPEQEIARYRPSRKVRFSCDGCAGGLTATIRYVSPRAEFTPPVIYSRDSRDRLVYLVEAYPARPAGLQPGLPVDVEPLP